MEIDKRNSEQNYKDEHKHEKIVSNKHFIHDIEIHNPLSLSYKNYWKEIKRRCIEGYWVEGKWMPGNLYFYVNLIKIKLNKDEYSSTKIEARPFLRDLEWEKAYVFAEARGFSGFRDDDEHTCFREVEEIETLIKQNLTWDELHVLPTTCYNSKGELKKFKNPRLYLREIKSKNLGKPLYQNDAWNVIDIEARGSGKSYWAGNGMILHNFLIDGATDYDEYMHLLNTGNRLTSETLVGAIDSAYSKDLLNKTQMGIDTLVGEQIFQGATYPSPLLKEFTGSWFSGKKYIEAKVEKNIGGKWKKVGSGSTIHHRSFNDDPFAGNGTRPSVACLEEVGFFHNLKESLGAMKDTTKNGPNKFGSIFMFGTGGSMKNGASEAARDIFNDPSSYDCLSFNDIWEETGSIGFFIPYELALNKFKNEEGITDMKRATMFADNVRNKLINGKSKAPLYDEMQNNPRTPSEAFFTQNSNIFPIAELKEHLGWLKSMQGDGFVKGQCGELVWEQNEGQEQLNLQWKPDLKNRLTPCWYRMKKSDDTTGCIQIWEHPVLGVDGRAPFGLYIAGTDPYDQDQSTTSSLGSTFIYKTFYNGDSLNEMVVAEYTARPGTAEEHHETVRKLLMYYNAVDLYENERNSLKMHFSHKHSLYLLAKTPTILKATEGSKVERQYGIHMTDHIKDELEIYTRDWLLKDAGAGKLNLHKIYSMPLLEELISYNRVGNFDRGISFMLTICNRLSNYHMKVEGIQEQKLVTDPFFSRAFSGGFF